VSDVSSEFLAPLVVARLGARDLAGLPGAVALVMAVVLAKFEDSPAVAATAYRRSLLHKSLHFNSLYPSCDKMDNVARDRGGEINYKSDRV